jgi:hypothetical protein
MSLICDLSEVLVDSLLLSWVVVEDVGRLDSAVCNTSQRPTFLSLVNRDKFVFQQPPARQDRGENNDPHVDQFLSWVMRRDIAVAELIVSSSFTNNTDVRFRYLQLHGKYIHKVTLRKGAGTLRNYKAAFKDICAHCPNVVVPVPSAPSRVYYTLPSRRTGKS